MSVSNNNITTRTNSDVLHLNGREAQIAQFNSRPDDALTMLSFTAAFLLNQYELKRIMPLTVYSEPGLIYVSLTESLLIVSSSYEEYDWLSAIFVGLQLRKLYFDAFREAFARANSIVLACLYSGPRRRFVDRVTRSMARASVRWVALLLSIIGSLVVFTSFLSPATIHSAHDKAQAWRDSFHDNAGRTGFEEKIIGYGPKVYHQVQSWWMQLFPESEELRGLQPQEEEVDEFARCRVYTYYDKSKKSEDTEALLQVWIKAWWAIGLFPVVLTNEISVKHDQYAYIHEKFADVGLNLERIDAVLAMDYMNYEGMLTANYVFPMAPANDDLLREMRQCQVLDVMTKYRSTRDDIMRGSSLAYKVLAQSLVKYDSVVDRKRVEVLGMEGVPGVNFRELEETKTFAVYDDETVKKIYPKLFEGKPVGKGGKSFSFVKNQLASLVNGHLQDNFLVNHRGGIEVLTPDVDISDVDFVSRPSLRVAMELVRCNLTPLPKTCAPQHTSATTKCFDCSKLVSSSIIKQVPSYELKDFTFFVGNVPHPLTLLAMDRQNVEIDAAIVRASARDIWAKRALAGALTRHASAIQGLVHLSESLWRNEDNHLPDAQIWQTFENSSYADLEYEVGFSLPELKASLDQLAHTTREKSSGIRSTLNKAREIVYSKTDPVPKARELTEAWSQYDAGAHQLISNYVDYKSHRLETMKAANRGAFVILELP